MRFHLRFSNKLNHSPYFISVHVHSIQIWGDILLSIYFLCSLYFLVSYLLSTLPNMVPVLILPISMLIECDIINGGMLWNWCVHWCLWVMLVFGWKAFCRTKNSLFGFPCHGTGCCRLDASILLGHYFMLNDIMMSVLIFYNISAFLTC